MKNQLYYQSKINQGLDFINKNLDKKIQVNQIAAAANFSSFHFQRLYAAFQDETVYDTILRLRLEKAVFLLKHHSIKKIKTIAYECGFSSAENFSRQFKVRYDCTPSAFKNDKSLHNSRIYQDKLLEETYLYLQKEVKTPTPSFEVKVEYLELIPIAFIRVIFGKAGALLIRRYEELMTWAKANKLQTKGELTRFGMSIDNHNVTPADKYRYDFAIAFRGQVTQSGLVELGEIPKGFYATLHVIGKLEVVAQAWDYLYKQWLPQSDYEPIHYQAIEEFIKGPEEIGWDNFNVKCRIPIRKSNANC